MADKKNILARRPGLRLLLRFSLVVVACAVVGGSFWWVAMALFSGNPNFTLRVVVVRSKGWWGGRSAKVEEVIGVESGKTNVFEVDLRKAKRALEKEASIRRASVSRVLPDILVVDITERTPKAFLYWRDGRKVVDGEGVVMLSNECSAISPNLPVLTGFRASREELFPGARIVSLGAALRLLEGLSRSAPRLMVRKVVLGNPSFFKVLAHYPGMTGEFELYLDRKRLAGKLANLDRVLRGVVSERPNARTVDMRYNGQAVAR